MQRARPHDHRPQRVMQSVPSQEPVGLGKRRLQIDRSEPIFTFRRPKPNRRLAMKRIHRVESSGKRRGASRLFQSGDIHCVSRQSYEKRDRPDHCHRRSANLESRMKVKNGRQEISGSARISRAGGSVLDEQLVKQLTRRDAAPGTREVCAPPISQ